LAAASDNGLPKVLLIDDDPALREFVTTALAGAIEIDAVGTAGEGIDKASSGNYDGVLVDQALPDLAGVEVIRLLRSEARTSVLPVMLFTGHPSDDLETEARHAGADEFLAKPVEPAVLEERLLALVTRNAEVG
jgi:DNA-binding response OmpR family regulator